ncbi:MAG: HEAT repeat domain-containing protein [bacterium]
MEWYERLGIKEKDLVTIALFKFDLAGSTNLKDDIKAYHDLVENTLTGFNCAPFEFQGDGATVYFLGEDGLYNAICAGKKLLEEIRRTLEYEAHIRIGIGVDKVNFKKELGKIQSDQFNLAGHSESACPKDSLVLTEEGWLSLPDREKEEFSFLGTTIKDKSPLFVYPKTRKIDKEDMFIPPSQDTYPAKRDYLNFIKQRYGKIIPRGLRQEHLISINLFDIFSPLKFRTEYVDIWMRDFKDIESLTKEDIIVRRAPALSALSLVEVLKRRKNAVILGSPGAGKSTLIKYLALSCVSGRIDIKERLSLDEPLFPFPISVGHLCQIWQENKRQIGVKEAIILYFKILGIDISRFIDEEIERAIFLFDGMDEVPSDRERREIAGLIESFIQAYPKARFIITSRIIGFPGLSFENRDIYFIEDLTLEEAKPMIRKWMIAIEQGLRGKGEDGERMAKDEAEKLIEVLNEPQLSPFIANPFLLTLTILIHKTEAHLPNYRIQLFERMIQTLVETWHQARSISIIQPEAQRIDFRTEAIPILAPLALKLHKEFPAGIIPEDNLRDFIKQKLLEKGIAKERIEEILNNFLERLKEASGLLEEKGRGFWGFAHLSFEEYLCAIELVRGELYFEYLKEFSYSSRWEEVFILVSSELGITQASTKRVSDYLKKILEGKGDKINEGILKKNILLAGRCLASSANVEIGLVDEITSSLIEFLFGKIGGLSSRAARILKDASSIERVRERIREAILSKSQGSAISAIADLGIKDEWAIEAIKQGLRDEYSWVRTYAISAIAKLGIKDEWAIKAIKGGLKDKDKWRRHSAILVLAIANLGIKDEWAIEAIKQGLRDEDEFVRHSAILAIAKLGIKDGWAISAIKEGLRDKDLLVRGPAISAIANLGIKDEWAISAIKEGLRDKDEWVRRSAISTIAKLGIKDEWAIKAIKQGLEDKDKWVRGYAISAIAKLGIKDSWAIGAIKQGLKDPEVRGDAISAIADLGIEKEWAIEAIIKDIETHRLSNASYEALWRLLE